MEREPIRALLPLFAVLLVALTIGSIVRRAVAANAEPPTMLLVP